MAEMIRIERKGANSGNKTCHVLANKLTKSRIGQMADAMT
jgi:hypothetical protein